MLRNRTVFLLSIISATLILACTSCGKNHDTDNSAGFNEIDSVWNFGYFLNGYSRCTKVALNIDGINDNYFFEDYTPDSLYQFLYQNIVELSESEGKPLLELFDEVYDQFNSNLQKRVEKRFGVAHSLFRIPLSWYTSKSKRKARAEDFFMRELTPENIERLVNIRVESINGGIEDSRKLSYVKMSSPKEGQIVDLSLFEEIRNREAMEYFGELMQSLVFWLITIALFIVTFVIGKNIAAFVIAEAVSSLVCLIVNITIVAFRSIEIEDVIYNHLVYNFWQYLVDSGLITQLLGQ